MAYKASLKAYKLVYTTWALRCAVGVRLFTFIWNSELYLHLAAKGPVEGQFRLIILNATRSLSPHNWVVSVPSRENFKPPSYGEPEGSQLGSLLKKLSFAK